MKEKLALAIGHILGDGGINSQGRVYYCNTEKFLIDEFINSMKVFGIEPWIRNEENIIGVVYPVCVGKKLWDLFGKFSSGKDTKRITNEIQLMPLEWKTQMLTAWFNDDGSVVNYPPNYKAIAIKQKLRNLIDFIDETLKELGISSKISKDGAWLLRIFGYKNIIKFKDKINFSKNYRKNIKLKELVKTINHPHFITKNKILELLKESPKTRVEISERLNLNPQVIYGHLHGWKRKKKKTNLGLIDLGFVKITKNMGLNIYALSNSAPSPGFGWEGTSAGTSAQC